MARDRRMICRSSFTSKKLAKCTDSEHLLFYALVLNADDEGRGEGDPLTITLICANRRWSEEQAEQMMMTLRTLELVSWYTVDGDHFYEVVDFDRYQQGSWQGKHKKNSLIPKISEGGHRVRCTRTLVSEKSVAKLMECNVMESKVSKDITSEVGTSDATPSVFDKESDECLLADFMITRIRRNKPDYKQPNLQAWSKDFDLLLRVDGRVREEVTGLIMWVQEDDFEKTNVLSPAKLRKRYDQLVMKATEDLGRRPWEPWEDDDEQTAEDN